MAVSQPTGRSSFSFGAFDWTSFKYLIRSTVHCSKPRAHGGTQEGCPVRFVPPESCPTKKQLKICAFECAQCRCHIPSARRIITDPPNRKADVQQQTLRTENRLGSRSPGTVEISCASASSSYGCSSKVPRTGPRQSMTISFFWPKTPQHYMSLNICEFNPRKGIDYSRFAKAPSQ